MSELRNALEEYLEMRRALGFNLRLLGSSLHRFVSFMDREGASFITTELALRWACQPAGVQPRTCAWRLSMVRIFARYCSASDPRTEIPPPDLLPYRRRRREPFIYSDEQILALVRAAAGLPSYRGLRGHTYSTVFGLMAVTGMRISEPIALDRDDVDLEEGILTVRRTKFGKTRLVPVHPTTRAALHRYARHRDRVLRAPTDPAFFLSEKGTRLTEWSVRWTFAKVSCQVGLRQPSRSHGHGPRLHDLRHSMAVSTLLEWYRQGADVQRRLPVLSTYLGHVHVNDTYWYLTAVPELLQLAAARLQDDAGGAPS